MGNSQSAAEESVDAAQETEPMQTAAPTTAKRTASEAEAPSSQAEGDESDPLHYLKRNTLTNVSEQFKVELKGLPRHANVPDLKRLAKKLNLDCKKVRKSHSEIGYLCFASQEALDTAIATLDGYEYKKSTLRAKVGKPALDPFVVQKRKQSRDPAAKRAKSVEEEGKSPEEVIALRTAPYCEVPYPEQLTRKQADLTSLLEKCGRVMTSKKGGFVDWAEDNMKKLGGVPCPVLEMVASPVLDEYRNKCEFTIGTAADGKTVTVGFQLGQYSEGTIAIAEPTLVPHVPATFKKLAKALQTFVREESGLLPYHRLKHEGHYRQVTIRASRTGELMMILQMSDRNLEPAQVEEETTKLKGLLAKVNAEGINLRHLLVQVDNSVSGLTDPERKTHCLVGEETMIDTLLGKKFRVSPDAFFQVNVPAAEILYKLVGDWCSFDSSAASNTCLLDICCGTGTIGQIYSGQVKRVLGFELVEQAVDDARVNAEMNNAENCTYFAGKAEQTMAKVVQGVHDARVVGIVDPPRAGLHASVVKAIRRCPQLETLVFVACNFKASSTNIVDLCRPASKNYQGTPFQLIQAQGVDLFPQTPHMEVVLLLLRGRALTNHLAASKDA